MERRPRSSEQDKALTCEHRVRLVALTRQFKQMEFEHAELSKQFELVGQEAANYEQRIESLESNSVALHKQLDLMARERAALTQSLARSEKRLAEAEELCEKAERAKRHAEGGARRAKSVQSVLEQQRDRAEAKLRQLSQSATSVQSPGVKSTSAGRQTTGGEDVSFEGVPEISYDGESGVAELKSLVRILQQSARVDKEEIKKLNGQLRHAYEELESRSAQSIKLRSQTATSAELAEDGRLLTVIAARALGFAFGEASQLPMMAASRRGAEQGEDNEFGEESIGGLEQRLQALGLVSSLRWESTAQGGVIKFNLDPGFSTESSIPRFVAGYIAVRVSQVVGKSLWWQEFRREPQGYVLRVLVEEF